MNKTKLQRKLVYEFRDLIEEKMEWLSEEYMQLNPFYILGNILYMEFSDEDRLCIQEQLIGEYLEMI